MNEYQLSRIKLRGFKSIRECDLELNELNVLIGPNGAGKSNFISFFRLIQQMLEGNLQRYVSKQGGPDALLHFGRKRTKNLSAELQFGFKGYKFILEPTQDNRLMFAEEKYRFNSLIIDENSWWDAYGDRGIKSGHFESAVQSQSGLMGILYPDTVAAMKNWRVYHFHDTSESSLVKQRHGLNDNLYLRPGCPQFGRISRPASGGAC